LFGIFLSLGWDLLIWAQAAWQGALPVKEPLRIPRKGGIGVLACGWAVDAGWPVDLQAIRFPLVGLWKHQALPC